MSLAVACVALVVLMAMLILQTFPIGFVNGAAAFWLRPEGDPAEHIIGGRYFVADSWRLPLLYVPSLGLPQGTNIGLTDSIPLAALAAKLLRGAIGTGRPYLPVWISVCYLLQGPAAAAALYVLGVRRAAPLILGGLIACFTPVLLIRFGHAALCAHFLLLLALALHLRIIGQKTWSGAWLGYVPLVLLALLVHVYLCAMIAAIWLASLLHGLWTERIGVRATGLQIAAVTVPAAGLMWLCGYLDLGPIPMKAYGEWALDLAAPFSPGPSGVFGVDGLPPGRSFEGFAWSGAGVLLLAVIALFAWRRGLSRIAALHFPTIVVVGALLVFAATYAVRIGPNLVLGVDSAIVRRAVLESAGSGGAMHHLIASLDLADGLRLALYALLLIVLSVGVFAYAWRRRKLRFLQFLCVMGVGLGIAAAVRPSAIALIISNFQASGRFVWVALYLIMLLAVAGVWRAFRPATALALLALALCLQVADTAPLWKALQRSAASEPGPIADEAAISEAMMSAQSVKLVPTYLCAHAEPIDAAERDRLASRIMDLGALVSRWVKPINSVRHSRMTATDVAGLTQSCATEVQDALSHSADRGTLTFALGGAPSEASMRAELMTRAECQSLPTGVLCLGTSSPGGR